MSQSLNILQFKNWLFFSIIAISLPSCIIDNKDKDTVIQVEDEFAIKMIEQLGAPRQLNFQFESVEMEPCLNSSIDRTVIIEDSRVSILLEGIVQATDCTPGIAVATALGNAGHLSAKIYDFDVTLRNTVENTGKLRVDSEKYEINLSTSDGLVIENNILYKIPEEFIWGYYAYDDETMVGNEPESFLNELATISQTKNLTEGEYGHFKITDDQKMELKTSPDKAFFKTFYYNYTGDKADIHSLLEGYRSSPVAGYMELAIFTSEGEAF